MTAEEIIQKTCEAFEITPSFFLSDSQEFTVVFPRFMVATILSEMKIDNAEIGRKINRHRTSIIYHKKTHRWEMENNTIYAHNFQQLCDYINGKVNLSELAIIKKPHKKTLLRA